MSSTPSDSPTLDDQAALLTPERASTSDTGQWMDAALGLAVVAVAASRRAAGRARFVLRPISAVGHAPFRLGRRMLGDRRVGELLARGSSERQHAVTALSRLIDHLTPRVAEAVLARVDAADLVLRHVDLDHSSSMSRSTRSWRRWTLRRCWTGWTWTRSWRGRTCRR